MAAIPYDNITIKEIAREADVSEKTVQRHFVSKHAIFVAYAQEAVAAVSGRLAESANGHDAQSAVRRLMRAVYGEYEEHKDEIWAFIRAESTSPEIARFRAFAREFGDFLAGSVVDAWPEAWRFDRERTRQVLAGLTRFLAWKLLREECGLSPEEAVFAITETVATTLMKPVVRAEQHA